jgi:hypothetical protein
MRPWLKKHFPVIDENVDRIGYWSGFVVLVWTVMSAIVGSIPSVSQYGWGAVVLVGLGVACIFALVMSACLVAWRYFNPIAPQPKPVGAADAPTTAPETIPLHRFTAALQKAGLLEFKFEEAVQKIDTFIANAKTEQEAREKLIGQMRSALTARRQLELAQELFAAVEKAYAKIGDPDEIDLDTFTQDNNTAQSLMRRYYNDFLQNNDAAKDLFKVSPHELSPSYWKGVNLSKLATDRETEHQFKTSRLWFVRISGHHNELRGRNNRLIDFEGRESTG